MNFLFLGDIVGRAGRIAVIEKLPKIISDHKIDFVIANGENSAGGYGITPSICDELFKCGVDVITSGNHIWDQKEIIKLKTHVDFLLIDFHAELTSEKQAMGHLLDGKATLVVGTHTHTPTLDYRILDKGTAFQTDAGMCGDYNSVIGMKKENAILRFFKKKTDRLVPAMEVPTISGIIVEGNNDTGLAKNIYPILTGGNLKYKS
jgi:calcineurin-like phosphoesterase